MTDIQASNAAFPALEWTTLGPNWDLMISDYPGIKGRYEDGSAPKPSASAPKAFEQFPLDCGLTVIRGTFRGRPYDVTYMTGNDASELQAWREIATKIERDCNG